MTIQGGAEKAYKNGYRGKMLKLGLDYEKFVYEVLPAQKRINIEPCKTKKEQYLYGENIAGWEIKFDRNFRNTNNLYIETGEKNWDAPHFTPSGIHKASWNYLIGDYQTIYVFTAKFLVASERKYEPVVTETSKGFLLPLSDAEEICQIRIDVEPRDKLL